MTDAKNGKSEVKGKKERVIHTRVDETLDEEIRARAEGLGVSVSNLIRNVLGHAFGLVEDVVTDSANVARAARGERVDGPDDNAAAATIIGWQRLTMNMNAICTRCNAIVVKGTEGAVSVTDRPADRTVICTGCFKELQQ